MILKFEQIQAIVKDRPNKKAIQHGREKSEKLMLHLHGQGMETAISHVDTFVSKPIHDVQKKYAVSNVDLFKRLLQQEDMVFSARGGSSRFNLPDTDERTMNEILANVSYGFNLRKWVRNFALQAYRCDPMGIVFMEVDKQEVGQDGQLQAPRAYPTYKSVFSIWDYATTGRRLEYVAFRLTVGECRAFGIVDERLKEMSADAESDYYRVVDDAKDVIVQRDGEVVRLVTKMQQANPIPNRWERTPGFIISDLVRFNNPAEFVSPVDTLVELADCFLWDRSVRELQKKYHGFAKAVEPLMDCPTCAGTGFVAAKPCPSCAPAGAIKGSGFKTQTKISDVARFPLSILAEGSFDFKRIFGYVTPDIEGWDKQDSSLSDLERLMDLTYWGTTRASTPGTVNANEKTATEVYDNQAPREARLNMTADWAETTEAYIADFIGKFWFDNRWKKASIAYGRDYILKSSEQLMLEYQEMRTKGAPDFCLDEALEKYYQAKYQTNPLMQVKYLKMLDVEPFPHLKVSEAKAIITDFVDYNCKLYFGEWANTIPDGRWIIDKPEVLIAQLKEYVGAKGLVEPVPEPVKPSFN